MKWITESLGTAKMEEIDDNNYAIVDVRDLVDKEGNSKQAIVQKIHTVVDLLHQRRQVIVCCDYGMSRSNAIAVGAIVQYFSYDFDKAVKLVMEKTREKAIDIGMLNSVRQSLQHSKKDQIVHSIDEKKKVLITGGTGFIGSALANTLRQSYRIIAPTRQVANLLEGPIPLDLLVKNTGVDTIIHLANPRKYTTTTAMGHSLVMLKSVLDVCKENGLSLLYVSSWVVYSGYNSSCLRASESLPLRTKGTYGETKVLCETLINHYRDMHDLSIYILRLSPVYGFGSDKPKFIYTFFQKALKGETIFTHKYLNGLPVLDLIHVTDAIRAIECVMKTFPTHACDVNIGSGIGYSTFDIAKMIKELCSSPSVIRHHEIDDFFANIIMDISKIKQLYGWYPQVNLQNGLHEIFDKLHQPESGWKNGGSNPKHDRKD